MGCLMCHPPLNEQLIFRTPVHKGAGPVQRFFPFSRCFRLLPGSFLCKFTGSFFKSRGFVVDAHWLGLKDNFIDSETVYQGYIRKKQEIGNNSTRRCDAIINIQHLKTTTSHVSNEGWSSHWKPSGYRVLCLGYAWKGWTWRCRRLSETRRFAELTDTRWETFFLWKSHGVWDPIELVCGFQLSKSLELVGLSKDRSIRH